MLKQRALGYCNLSARVDFCMILIGYRRNNSIPPLIKSSQTAVSKHYHNNKAYDSNQNTLADTRLADSRVEHLVVCFQVRHRY
jgi:hypothetical protein